MRRGCIHRGSRTTVAARFAALVFAAFTALVVAALVVTALAAASPEASARGPRPRAVRIESTPPGALVRLGSADAAPLGATPLRRIKVAAGEQTFVFTLDGYESQVVTVPVTRHGQKIRVALERAAVLDISAADEPTFGAALVIDGAPADRVPQRRQVSPGRHLLEVSREGHAPSQRWVSVERGQVLAVPMQLGDAVTQGLVVTSDVAGAEVWVDGDFRGAAPLLWADAPLGKRAIEVRTPDRAPYRTTVELVAGARRNVEARFSGARGGVRVSADAPSAVVWLDGTRLGATPAGRDDLLAGEHLLEVHSKGYWPLSETIVVAGGQRHVLTVALEPRAGDPVGAIIVTARTPGAIVTIAGRDYGAVPVLAEGLAPGEHPVTVAAPGHIPLATTCRVAAGRECRVDASLVAGGERLIVRAAVDGGTLFVDDVALGPLPYDGGIALGTHTLRARAPGFGDWEQVVTVAAGQPAGVFDASLTVVVPERRGSFVHAADVVAPGRMAVDASVGWVPLGEVRFDVGILPYLDAGAALRSFGRLTEVEARVKAAYRFIPLVSAGVQLRAGGGAGPRDVNSGYVLLELLGSVHLEPHAAFTLLVATDVTSDHYPFAETDSDVPAAAAGRQTAVGFRFGGNVEVAVADAWTIWAGLEWTPARSESRRILGDLFGDGAEAANLWFRLGASHTF